MNAPKFPPMVNPDLAVKGWLDNEPLPVYQTVSIASSADNNTFLFDTKDGVHIVAAHRDGVYSVVVIDKVTLATVRQYDDTQTPHARSVFWMALAAKHAAGEPKVTAPVDESVTP